MFPARSISVFTLLVVSVLLGVASAVYAAELPPNDDATSQATRILKLAQNQSRQGLKAEAAATYKRLLEMQTNFPRLWIEYLRICEITIKDSPEYRAAIERSLANFDKQGGSDAYEITLRHLLGASYHNAKQYAKSTEILMPLFEKGWDADRQADDMLLVAKNARESRDFGTARKILHDAVARHPATSAGQAAQELLRQMDSQPDKWEKRTPWKGVFIGANVVAIALLMAVFVRRRIKRNST